MKQISMLVCGLFALLAVACNQGGGGGGGTASTPTYSINNGQCYQNNGQVVAMTYCQGGTAGYYMNGQICQNAQGQQFPIQYCQQGTTPINPGYQGYYPGYNQGYYPGYSNYGGYGGYGQRCYSYYYYANGYFGSQMVCR